MEISKINDGPDFKNWLANPLEHFLIVQANQFEDIENSKSPPLSIFKKEIGLEKTKGLINIFLIQLIESFNVGKNMNANQIKDASDLIMDEFYFFRPEDFKLCFQKAKKGHYGIIYDRIDGQIIFDWLYKYNDERISFFESKNKSESDKLKYQENKGETVKALAKVFKATREDLENENNKELEYAKFKKEYLKK